MEIDKSNQATSETARNSREKKKRSKDKDPKADLELTKEKSRSLRESWDYLLSNRDKRADKEEKPKKDEPLTKDVESRTKDDESDEETIADYSIDTVETVPLDEQIERSILLRREEETSPEPEYSASDTDLEILGVIDHNLEDNLDSPNNWDELVEVKDKPASIKPSVVEAAPNNSPASSENLVESLADIPEVNPEIESKPEAHLPVIDEQIFSSKDFIPVAELTSPELTQIAVNPNETLSVSTETRTLSAVSATGVTFTERLVSWRQTREIKKIKTKQRRHTKRLKQVKQLQQQNQQELSRYRSENERKVDQLKQELTHRTANPEVAAKPNKAARLDKEDLPKEAQLIVEQLHLPAEHRLEQSAWHAIEVDKRTGHAVEQPTAITYGSEFKHEQHQETWNQDSEEVAVASGQLAVGTVADVGIGSLNSPAVSQISQGGGASSSSSANPLGMTMRQSRLIGTKAADPVLWIILGVIIIAIIAAIKG